MSSLWCWRTKHELIHTSGACNLVERMRKHTNTLMSWQALKALLTKLGKRRRPPARRQRGIKQHMGRVFIVLPQAFAHLSPLAASRWCQC